MKKLCNLLILGKELIRIIKDKSMDYDEYSLNNKKNLFDLTGNIGYPRILVNGAPGLYCKQGIASSNGDVSWGRFELNETELLSPYFFCFIFPPPIPQTNS